MTLMRGTADAWALKFRITYEVNRCVIYRENLWENEVTALDLRSVPRLVPFSGKSPFKGLL